MACLTTVKYGPESLFGRSSSFLETTPLDITGGIDCSRRRHHCCEMKDLEVLT